jgi:hypothetical protein
VYASNRHRQKSGRARARKNGGVLQIGMLSPEGMGRLPRARTSARRTFLTFGSNRLIVHGNQLVSQQVSQ